MNTNEEIISVDNLPCPEVGKWVKDKHELLTRYVGISGAVRSKFNSRSEATYIDLFCGAGSAKIRGSGEIVDGSPLVVAKEAINHPTASYFSHFHIADENISLLNACHQRLSKVAPDAKVLPYQGRAVQTIMQITDALDPLGLHFAFLDPFKLGVLDFSIIEKLSTFKRMDILIHVSAMDLQRNLKVYLGEKSSELDSFAPGWREHIDINQAEHDIRMQIFHYWLGLVKSLGVFPATEGQVLIQNSNKAPLYWLVFVAKHALARTFWRDIKDYTGQIPLF